MSRPEDNIAPGSFTFSFIKPHAIKSSSSFAIKDAITKAGFEIVYQNTLQLTEDQICAFYPHIVDLFGLEGFQKCETYWSNAMSESEGLLLWSEQENTAQKFRKVLGSVALADQVAVGIRGVFGISHFMNAIHGSDSEQQAIGELCVYDPSAPKAVLLDERYGNRFKSALDRNNVQQDEVT